MAEHVLSFLEPGYEVRRVTLKVGRRLKNGETSKSGAYAILNERKNWILRVSLHKDVADYCCQDNSRYIAECYLVGKGKPV